MKTFFALTLILLSFNYTSAQGSFQRTFTGIGEASARSLHIGNDGNYFIVGQTKEFAVDEEKNDKLSRDIYLVKIDKNGDNIWSHTYGGAKDDTGFDIKETKDGNLFLLGRTKSNSRGSWDIIVYKLNSEGNKIWELTYGEAQNDQAYILQLTQDGGFVICGKSKSYGSSGHDMLVMKMDGEGHEMWRQLVGGPNNDYAYYIQEDKNGDFIMVGRGIGFKQGFFTDKEELRKAGSLGTGATKTDIIVTKIAQNGKHLWSRIFGNRYADSGYWIEPTSDDGYILAGRTNITDDGRDQDILVVKLNGEGSILWQNSYGDKKSEYGTAIQELNEGGYIVCGMTNSYGNGNYDAFLLKINQKGEKEWIKTYGGKKKDAASSVRQTADGGFIVAGQTKSVKGSDMRYAYLIKTEADGDALAFREYFKSIEKRKKED